jgi:hypothetical protein
MTATLLTNDDLHKTHPRSPRTEDSSQFCQQGLANFAVKKDGKILILIDGHLSGPSCAR